MEKRVGAFLKGIIIAFSVVILTEGLVLYGLPMLGINVEDTITYVTETISAAKNFFTGNNTVEASSGNSHILKGGPMEGKGSPLDSSSLDAPANTGEEYTFDSTTYPYRALLSEDAQEVYNQIYSNALAYNTDTFTLVNSLSEDVLCSTMNCMFNDHPELFWLNTSYKYGYNSNGQVVQVQLSYGISSEDLDSASSAFNSSVSTIVEAAMTYSSDIEKELYIHDAICDLATYDSSASLNQSSYSALVTNSSVCAGYSRAFQYACQEAGLTCYYLTGTASGGDHAWNIISIDGDFYNVDCTWDDSISESYGSSVYTYFNLTDSEISKDHTRSELASLLPSCTATEMSYTNVYGSTVEIDDVTTGDGGQITDGNFTIQEPTEPVTDWHDGPAPDMNENMQMMPMEQKRGPGGMNPPKGPQ